MGPRHGSAQGGEGVQTCDGAGIVRARPGRRRWRCLSGRLSWLRSLHGCRASRSGDRFALVRRGIVCRVATGKRPAGPIRGGAHGAPTPALAPFTRPRPPRPRPASHPKAFLTARAMGSTVRPPLAAAVIPLAAWSVAARLLCRRHRPGAKSGFGRPARAGMAQKQSPLAVWVAPRASSLRTVVSVI
jgi:hypothetical protein